MINEYIIKFVNREGILDTPLFIERHYALN